MLEKRQKLKKIEIIFMEDQIHPDCHYVYENQVVEDGNVIMRKNHREVKKSSEAKQILSEKRILTDEEILNIASIK